MKRGFCLVLSSFGAGKTASKFHNSLKNSRDRFDSWLTNVRVGWRDGVLKGMMHFVELYHGEFSEERLLRALRNIHPVDIYRIGAL